MWKMVDNEIPTRAEEKQSSRSFRRQRVDPGADKKHQPQRRQYQDPHQRTLKQFRAGELIGQERDNAGQADTRGHVVVNAQHVSAQASVYRDGAVGGTAARGYISIVIRHGLVPP